MQANRADTFFVVTALSNFCRYRRRPELYAQFAEMCRQAEVELITVELTTPERSFEVTNACNRNHLQLRGQDEFWHKENLINRGIAHGRCLFPRANKVAWVDADCSPARPPKLAFDEIWHELERYKFVQCWEMLQPLDYHYAPVCPPNPSFMSNYVKHGTPYPKAHRGYPKQWGSPGLAWAANISCLDEISSGYGSGIPDVAILGAGDWYLAHALISDLPFPEMSGYSPGYLHYWQNLQRRCNRWIKRDVGFVRGLWYHYWHGKTVNRGYNTRERILIDNQYDPYEDLKRDVNGVYMLETWEPRQILMYDQIRAYFGARNEDDIVV